MNPDFDVLADLAEGNDNAEFLTAFTQRIRADERRRALEEAEAICDEEAHFIDNRLPNAFGGNFAKKFAANGIRGVAGRIHALIETTPAGQHDSGAPPTNLNVAAQASELPNSQRLGEAPDEPAPAALVQQELTMEDIQRMRSNEEDGYWDGGYQGSFNEWNALHDLALRGLERPSKEAVRVAREFLDESRLVKATTPIATLAREILRLNGEKP